MKGARDIVSSLQERVNLLHTQKRSELAVLEKQRAEVQTKFAGEIETIASQQIILEFRIQAIEDKILALQNITDSLHGQIKAAKPKIIRAMLQGRNVTGIVSPIEAEIEKAFAQSSVSKK